MPQSIATDDITLTLTTHLDNLPSILRDGGVSCPNERGPHYHEIFSIEIMQRRAGQIVDVASGLTLGGCVGLTMTPKTPAHYAVATGYGVPRVPNEEIVHLEVGVVALTDRLVGVADRNPLARGAHFIAGIAGFDGVDWEVIASGSFAKTGDDPTRPTRAAAEALIRDQMPLSAVQRIACWNAAVALTVTGMLHDAGLSIPVEVRPKIFFSAGM